MEIHHKKITGNLGGISVSYAGKMHFSQAFVKIISTYNTGILFPSVFFQVMMNNIKRIVQAGFDCDQIMLRSWSILWSLTGK